MPSADPRRRRKRASAKRASTKPAAPKRPGSIRDAAASAAGSAPLLEAPPPARPGDAATRESETPNRRTPSRRTRGARPTAAKPAFPDFETPSAGWDPWDQTIEGPRGDDVFDPNRTLGDWLEAVIPPEAQVHFIRAGQEFAAGVQTTVDHHLGRRDGEPGSDGATRIEIE